jgi:hypothetical protein
LRKINNKVVNQEQPLNNMEKQQHTRHIQSFGEQDGEIPVFEAMTEGKAEVFDEIMRLQYGMESPIEEEEVLDSIMKEDVGLLNMEEFEKEELEDNAFIASEEEEEPEYYLGEEIEKGFLDFGEIPTIVDPDFVETDPTDDEEENFYDVMMEEEFEFEIETILEEKEEQLEDEVFDKMMRMRYGMTAQMEDDPTIIIP